LIFDTTTQTERTKIRGLPFGSPLCIAPAWFRLALIELADGNREGGLDVSVRLQNELRPSCALLLRMENGIGSITPVEQAPTSMTRNSHE